MQSSEATAGLYIPMVSPPFTASQNYCLHFHYKVWMSESVSGHNGHEPKWPKPKQPQTFSTEVLERSPELEVYLSQCSHVFSGRKVWGSDGTGEGLAQIPVWARPGALYRISFVGITYNPLTTLINVANVRLDQDECSSRCDGLVSRDEIYDSSAACKVLCRNAVI